ncbi:hypothetical protein LCGC14_0386060 [marine sediment metagenome]|uniref:Right handed beta helix domain-containing protein n=1 Tax=marine sediment metagenome TaxID=412755 RepID=A0A0F9TJ06_9ZZZZ
MNGILWRGMQKFKNIEIVQGGVHIGLPGGPAPPTTDYFVDTTLGKSGNSGLGWGTGHALATISQAMTKANALATRGRFRIFAAPGGYTEDIETPINANAPFGQLIAVNPTPGHSFGAAYLLASTALAPTLSVRARGWLIEGFEIEALADAVALDLDGSVSARNAGGTLIQDCLFVGLNQGLAGVDFKSNSNGNPHVTILSCGMYGFTSGSTAGRCITCTNSSLDQPRFLIVRGCWFADSDNLIDFNGKGSKESVFEHNSFQDNGANQNPAQLLDLGTGNDNMVTQNKLGGTYSKAGGYEPGTNDDWGGNFNVLSGGVTAALPG